MDEKDKQVTCDKCKQPTEDAKVYQDYGYPTLCPECYDAMDKWIAETDAAESIAEQRAEQRNEEILAGMHAPDDYGDYMDRLSMLWDDDFN